LGAVALEADEGAARIAVLFEPVGEDETWDVVIRMREDCMEKGVFSRDCSFAGHIGGSRGIGAFGDTDIVCVRDRRASDATHQRKERRAVRSTNLIKPQRATEAAV